MYFFYSVLLACAALLTLPWWVIQMLRHGKYRTGLPERLGRVPERLAGARQGSIWIHAVSVGEVLAVSQLVTQLRSIYPGKTIFVSTTTLTGQRLARERFGNEHCFFMPLDFGFAVRPYLRLLKPQMLILAETEFWPNLLHLAKKDHVAVAVVNARISDRSFPRYRKFLAFFARALAPVDLFLAQTADDAARLREIGAPAARVQVSGNLKFDVRPVTGLRLANDIRSVLGPASPVVVCGSTAEGEEEPVLSAYKAVRAKFPSAVMVLAPRHPERFDRVAAMVTASGEKLVRRSTWTPPAFVAGSVFLLDSVGELASIYSVADIAFVGGSLVPGGGHNILEPAQHGAAILVGPHTFNFREIVGLFEQGGALRVVNAETLGQTQLSLLQNPEERWRIGQQARVLFAQHAGATQRTLHALRPFLEGPAGAKQ